MTTFILMPEEEVIKLLPGESDTLIIPSDAASNDLILKFQTPDRIDITAFPGLTAEELIENAQPILAGTMLSGTFGELTLLGIAVRQLRPLNFITTVNQSPTAVADEVTIFENTTVTIDVLANDSDPEGEAIAISDLPEISDNGGSISLVENQLEYSPPEGFVGTDSFSYTISDENDGVDEAIVTVVVEPETVENQPPIAENDAFTIIEGTSAVPFLVLGNDFDPDGDPISVTGVSSPDNGIATISDNQILYEPETGFEGTDTFTYTISDGNGGLDTATVEVAVTVTLTPSSTITWVGESGFWDEAENWDLQRVPSASDYRCS